MALTAATGNTYLVTVFYYVLDFLTILCSCCFVFFFFNDTATTEIYTLSLHDALPISRSHRRGSHDAARADRTRRPRGDHRLDRKSTRLNSSHLGISYAVFCLKKKKKKKR